MSRRPRVEMQFGSDSFLDVLANIVGILIILIVIAGLRVSQSPVRFPGSESTGVETPTAPEILADENTDEDDPLAPEFAPENGQENSAPPAPVAAVETPRELPPLEPPPDLTSAAQQLSTEVQRLEQGLRAATEQTAAVRQLEAELKEQLARLQGQVSSQERTARSLADDVESRKTNIGQLQQTLAQLRRQIAEEEQKADPVETLEHQVTPISKVVEGHEQHYRLLGNRVSEVPVASLSFRLREQIGRRKDWLLKQRSHQGVVGPIGGYSMHYVVQRDNLGVLDEVRYGQGMVKISVSNWRIEPEPDLEAESVEEALRQGSRFYESLITADEGTTLTFWVYPDSYGLYRKLQSFAHKQGFLVAGRPLPHGIGISGSPSGSKSAGQ